MPALPAVAKVCRVDMHLQFGTDANMMWRTFWRYDGTLNQTDANNWTAAIYAAWHAASSFQSITSTQVTLEKVELTDLSSTSAPQAVTTGSTAGTNSTLPLPAGVAAVISFKMARRYRGGHPRIYIPGLVGTYLGSPQTWSSGAIALIGAAFSTWAVAVEAGAPSAVGTAIQVGVSYFQGFTNVTFPSGRTRPVPKQRAGGPVVDVFTNAFVNPVVASQRRRNQQP